MERLKILIFRIRGTYFALPSNNVKEIIDSYENLKTVFYDRKALKGLMNFEGDVVSILNTPFILDIKEDGEDPLILLCKEKGMERVTGMTISEVRGMKVTTVSMINPSEEKDAPYITGVLREEDGEMERTVALIDLKRFLDYAETKIDKL
ncbi:MAG TPA: chemotaxis protein CheW [Thermodesulfobacteriota bacterium]|nr:chemotaxis protein CheW [Thermodesulfobacteriota bacterium]